jgi:hypothetical protein
MSYILGYYAPSDHLLETLANKKRRKMLNALVNSHPKPMEIKDIASKGKVRMKTVYGATYLGRLKEDGFVREVDEIEETGGPSRYVFENVNSLLRDRDPKYSLAPGNVEYRDEFKSLLNKLITQTEIKPKFRILLEFVKYIVESVKESGEQQIALKEDRIQLCSTCGLNHEARDFIRATLLYLLDRFEQSSEYLEFLREKNYLKKEHYNEYSKLIQTNLGKRKSGGLLAETLFTPSEKYEERIVEKAAHHNVHMTEIQINLPKTEEERVAEAWFEGLKGTIRMIVEYIVSEKPEMSKIQIMHLFTTV